MTSIIIAVWNALPFVKKCINAVRANTIYPYELIVIDNGSRKDAVEYISKLDCKKIFNADNMGCTVAWNQGINISQGNYLCFLNSDTEPAKNWLTYMVRTMESDDKIGVVGPTCNNISSIQGERIRWGKDDFQIPKGYVMPFVCALFRRSIFKEIGLFPTKFGGHHEDVVYCEALDKQGYKKMVAAKSFVLHHLSRTYAENGINPVKIQREAAIRGNSIKEETIFLKD